MEHYQTAFKAHLKRKMLRSTRQRSKVTDYALSRRGHFTAEQLHGELARRRAGVSRATVYRTLALLVDAGLLREAMDSQGGVRFEPAFGHHDHLVCVSCGKVIEFHNPTIESLQRRVCSRHEFAPVDHRLQIAGYCRDCARKLDRGGRK